MKSIQKILCTLLFFVVQPLALTFHLLAEKLATGATGTTPVSPEVAARLRADVLQQFVILCLQRVDELTDWKEGTEHGPRPDNRLWQEAVRLQGAASALGIEDNLLEIFGRCEASKEVNDFRRALRDEQAAHDESLTTSDKQRGGLVYRLAQATARLSVLQIEVESRLASARGLRRELGDTEEGRVQCFAYQNKIAALEEVLTLLDMTKTPQDEIRSRLQSFYDAHPDRRGTLRFTEAT